MWVGIALSGTVAGLACLLLGLVFDLGVANAFLGYVLGGMGGSFVYAKLLKSRGDRR